MRGAGRIGSKNWKVPPPKEGGESFNPFDLPSFGDLPVPPTLEPINDDWSISNFNEPVDPRDCSKYPASPYCGENPFSFGSPVGFDIEFRSNGCETCMYVYPVVAWLKLTPTIVCYSNPSCRNKPKPPSSPQDIPEIPDIPNGYRLVADLNRSMFFPANTNDFLKFAGSIEAFQADNKDWEDADVIYYTTQGENSYHFLYGIGTIARSYGQIGGNLGMQFYKQGIAFEVATKSDMRYLLTSLFRLTTGPVEATFIFDITKAYDWSDWFWSVDFYLVPIAGGESFPVETPKIKPPPPVPDDIEGGGKRSKPRKRDKDMCCNECKDTADISRKILKEIQAANKALGNGIATAAKLDLFLKEKKSKNLTEAIEEIWNLSRKSFNALGSGDISAEVQDALKSAVGIGKPKNITAAVGAVMTRLGAERYPIEVPESLLTGVGDKVQNVQSLTDYMYWLTHQLDALIGEFPIDFEIKDIDPLTAGDQPKRVQLPNLAETVAELYGLALKSTVNQEVDQAMLLRLATEVIAVKNGVAITQDYVKANTKFLGYRGNPAARELTYNFDFSSIDLNNKEQTVTLDKILKTTKAYIQGWENEDKDTAQNFFQKLMFSAGIIKAVFFRNKAQVKEMGKQAESMMQDELDNNKKWKEFLQGINSPNSEYNKRKAEIPEITEEKRDINKPL